MASKFFDKRTFHPTAYKSNVTRAYSPQLNASNVYLVILLLNTVNMHLLFDGVDSTHESTQTQASYLQELFATTIIIVITIMMIIIWKVERLKKDYNDSECIAHKKHNEEPIEAIGSSDHDINGDNNDGDVEIVLSDCDSSDVNVNYNNYRNGYDSNNESLIVQGAD